MTVRLVPQSLVTNTLEDFLFEFETAHRATMSGQPSDNGYEARMDQTLSVLYRLRLIDAEEFNELEQRIFQIKEKVELECASGAAGSMARQRL